MHGRRSPGGDPADVHGSALLEAYRDLGVRLEGASRVQDRLDGGLDTGHIRRGAGRRSLQSSPEAMGAAYGWPLRLQREQASKDGQGRVHMLFNSAVTEGLRLLLYRTYDPQRDDWVILQIRNFLPDTAQACFSEQEAVPATASGMTPADVLADCVRAAFSQFVYRAVVQVRQELAASGATRVMVDVRSNRGGSVALASLWAARFFDEPNAAGFLMPVRFRRSAALVSLCRFLQAKMASDPAWMRSEDVQERLEGLFLAALGGAAELWDPALHPTGNASSSRAPGGEGLGGEGLDLSWYTDPRRGKVPLPGGGFADLSDPVLALPPASILQSIHGRVWTAALPVTLNASNTVFLTNGMCGSACAQILRIVQRRGLARVLQAVVADQVHGQPTSFAGGVSVTSLQELGYFAAWAAGEGWDADGVEGGLALASPPLEPMDMSLSAGLAFCPPQLHLPCDLSLAQADATVTGRVLPIIALEESLDDEWEAFVGGFHDLVGEGPWGTEGEVAVGWGAGVGEAMDPVVWGLLGAGAALAAVLLCQVVLLPRAPGSG